MDATTTPGEFSRWQTVYQHPWELLLLPVLLLGGALTYEVAQIGRLILTTQGMLYAYILFGEGYAVVQARLYPGCWSEANTVSREAQFRAHYKLVVQWIIFGCITVYNTLATVLLIRQRARLHLLDGAIVLVVAVFLGRAWYVKRRSQKSLDTTVRQVQIIRATGFKIAPQYVQALNFAIVGSAGFSGVSLIAQISLAILRLIMAWRIAADVTTPGTGEMSVRARHRRACLAPLRIRRNSSADQPGLIDSQASLILNWRDFYSIVAMAVGWILGRWLAGR